MWSLKCGSRRPMSIWNSWEFMSTISIMRPSQHIRWQKQQLCLPPNWDFVLWMGGRIRCVASVGQKWRNPVHTSREGGCEDKGDYEARMPSIIRRTTPLRVYTHNNAWGTTDLSEVLSARWIRSCSTKKSLRLQSLFDTWLTRFQIRIDKMCTNLYNLCIKNVSDINMWHPS